MTVRPAPTDAVVPHAAEASEASEASRRGPARSWWRHTDPRTSGVLIIVTSLAVMAPGGDVFVPAGAGLGLLLAVADRAWRHAGVLAVVAVMLGFLAHGLPLLVMSTFSVIVGVAAAFVLRFVAIYGVALHFFRTGTPGTVTAALRAARVPRALTVPIAVVLRFMPIVLAEASAVVDSMRLQGLAGWRSLLGHPVLSIGRFTVPVIASTLRVGDDLTAAALLRGLGSYQRPTSRVPPRLGRPDLLWGAITGVLAAACWVMRGFL